MRAIQTYITVKNICQPGFALHSSCRHCLFCRRDCLREPAALCVSSCERPKKLGIITTRKLHRLLSELYRFDAITDGRIGSSCQHPGHIDARMGIFWSQGYCVFVMGDRLLDRTSPQESVTKAGMGIRVIGSYLERLHPICHCFVDTAFCKKSVPAIVIGICIIWLQFYRLLVVDDGFIGLSFSAQSVGEVHLHKS